MKLNARLPINIGESYKMSIGQGGMCRDNIEIIDVTGIYKMPVSVYFVSEVRTTQLLTVTLGPIVFKIITSLLFSGQTDNRLLR
jgi:hypothetical protein